MLYAVCGGLFVGLAGATFSLCTKPGWGRPQGAEGTGGIALALVIFGGGMASGTCCYWRLSFRFSAGVGHILAGLATFRARPGFSGCPLPSHDFYAVANQFFPERICHQLG